MRTGMSALAAWSCLVLSAAFVGGQDPKGKADLARAIDLPGYAGERGDVKKPARITSADELAKAIPNKEWQDAILKQVDFTREYLLFFAWAGSGQDRLTFAVINRGKVPAVDVIYRQGLTDDLRSHFRLFAVAKGASWRFRLIDDGEAAKPAVREIKGVNAVARGNKQTEIAKREELTRLFGEKVAARVLEQMDFTTEKLVWVTWAGSSSDSLKYRVGSSTGKVTVRITIHRPNPALTDLRPHGVLLVVPRDAAWEFAQLP
jgi:hypothetical protein